MIYIDFDGVILDTEELLFKEWRKNPNHRLLPEKEKIKYIQKADWKYIINNSKVINNALDYLKEMDPNKSAILTKVHSMDNEGKEKIDWLIKNNIKQNIILVPYYYKKTDIVNADNNILIDDCLKNLEDWESNNGYPLFFDMDDDNIDSWDQPNTKCYKRILNLSNINKE